MVTQDGTTLDLNGNGKTYTVKIKRVGTGFNVQQALIASGNNSIFSENIAENWLEVTTLLREFENREDVRALMR